MTNEIPATPRLMEGWCVLGFCRKGAPSHRLKHLPDDGIEGICGRFIWMSECVTSHIDNDYEPKCRRCLKALPK